MEPHYLSDSLLNIAVEHRDRIYPDVVMSSGDWREGKKKEGAKETAAL
ncbi:MAG TPA: hypothetical protein VFE21_11465 [Rubrobacteraceae bacterium]|nr:hypothetical protein [Rubrobacteraceae bacterium]